MTVVANAELAQSYSAQANTGRFFRNSRTVKEYGDSPHFPQKGSDLTG